MAEGYLICNVQTDANGTPILTRKVYKGQKAFPQQDFDSRAFLRRLPISQYNKKEVFDIMPTVGGRYKPVVLRVFVEPVASDSNGATRQCVCKARVGKNEFRQMGEKPYLVNFPKSAFYRKK